jgi:hypothetical protein
MWPSCRLKLASYDVEENYDDDDDDDDDDDNNNNNDKLNLTTSTCPREHLLHDIRKSLVRMQHDDRQTHELTPHTHRNLLTAHMEAENGFRISCYVF